MNEEELMRKDLCEERMKSVDEIKSDIKYIRDNMVKADDFQKHKDNHWSWIAITGGIIVLISFLLKFIPNFVR
jgi:hypothetical protein